MREQIAGRCVRARLRLTMSRQALLLVVVGPLLVSAPARATYSVAAVDESTGEVGGAVASCVGWLDLSSVIGTVAGIGVIHAQARLHIEGRLRGEALLRLGASPVEVVEALDSLTFDPLRSSRQYGVVHLVRPPAVYTGTRTISWAGGRTGQDAGIRWALQGNLLTGEEVLAQAEAGLREAGCDLSERLMQALEAGARGKAGDARCRPGQPADGAALRVVTPGGATRVALAVINSSGDPVAELRAKLNAWRDENPCPSSGSDPSPRPHSETLRTGCGCATGPKEARWPSFLLLAGVWKLRRKRSRLRAKHELWTAVPPPGPPANRASASAGQ